MRRLIRVSFISPPCFPALLVRWAGVIALSWGAIAGGFAAELHLDNGDRITGEVVRRENGNIYFQSPVFGEIVVAEVDAVVVDTPETPVESLTGLPPKDKTKAIKAPRLVEGADPDARKAASLPKWKGKMELGFTNQSGRRDSSNLSVRTEAELKKGPDNFRVTGRYLYGETNNVVASNRQDASFRWRHNISARIFAQSQSSYSRDQVSRINHNLEQNGSMGYQFLRSERHKASGGGGATLQYRDAEGLESRLSYLGEIFQEYTYKINGRLTLSQAINALYSPDGRGRTIKSLISTGTAVNTSDETYKVLFNSSLQGKMSEWISLNFRYEYEYDNAILDKNGRTDQRITSSVGYAF